MNSFHDYCKSACYGCSGLFEAIWNGYKACFETTDDQTIPLDVSKPSSEEMSTISAETTNLAKLKEQQDALKEQQDKLQASIDTAEDELKTTVNGSQEDKTDDGNTDSQTETV